MEYNIGRNMNAITFQERIVQLVKVRRAWLIGELSVRESRATLSGRKKRDSTLLLEEELAWCERALILVELGGHFETVAPEGVNKSALLLRVKQVYDERYGNRPKEVGTAAQQVLDMLKE